MNNEKMSCLSHQNSEKENLNNNNNNNELDSFKSVDTKIKFTVGYMFASAFCLRRPTLQEFGVNFLGKTQYLLNFTLFLFVRYEKESEYIIMVFFLINN